MIKNESFEKFIDEQAGRIICITKDASFSRVLRAALVPYTSKLEKIVSVHQSPDYASNAIDEARQGGSRFIVFIERMIEGELTTDAIFRICRLNPNAVVILLTSSISKEVAMYMTELGVSAILQKPASPNSILEKLELSLNVSKEQALKKYVHDLIADSWPDEALDVVNKFLEQNPKSSFAYSLKGDVLLATGESLKAMDSYERSHGLNPYFIEPLKRLAALYKYVDDLKALEVLKKVDQISSFNPDRKLEIAEIYLRSGEKDSAVAFLDEGFKQAAEEYNLLLGDIAERISDIASDKLPELAEKYMSQAIESKKTYTSLDLQLFNRLGIAYRVKGDWEKAAKTYRKALTVSIDDPALFYNMALAYYDGGAHSEVEKCLNKILEIDQSFGKDDVSVSYNLGSLFLRYKEYEHAKRCFQNVLQLNPDDSKAREKIGAIEARETKEADATGNSIK